MNHRNALVFENRRHCINVLLQDNTTTTHFSEKMFSKQRVACPYNANGWKEVSINTVLFNNTRDSCIGKQYRQARAILCRYVS